MLPLRLTRRLSVRQILNDLLDSIRLVSSGNLYQHDS